MSDYEVGFKDGRAQAFATMEKLYVEEARAIIHDLRMGKFDVQVSINLLRRLAGEPAIAFEPKEGV